MDINTEPFLLLVIVLTAATAAVNLALQGMKCFTRNTLIAQIVVGISGVLFIVWLTSDQAANLLIAEHAVHLVTTLVTNFWNVIQFLWKLVNR